MFANSLVVSLAVLAVASPAFSAPLPNPHSELEARLSLPSGVIGKLVKSLGGGLLSGGAIAGLEALLGGGSDDAAPAARELEARELDARLSLPAGTIGKLVKSLGGGLLSGGAIAGLEALLGVGGDDAAPAARELVEARGIASVLEKLVGAGAESIESVLKKAILGGVASGVAVEGVNAVAGQNSKRAVSAAVVGDAAKVAEEGKTKDPSVLRCHLYVHIPGIATVLGKGAASGLGSALGGLGIGAIFDKLFGGGDDSASKRSFADLSDEEVNTLLEWVNDNKDSLSLSPRGLSESITAILEKLFGNAVQKRSFADLTDSEVNTLLEWVNDNKDSILSTRAVQKRSFADLSDEEVNTLLEWVNDNKDSILSTRALPSALTGSIGKGIAGLVASLAATQGVESAIDELKKVFKREVSLDELD
ncbi:hypothetical protein C8J57DRAFT_1703818 [Mycena rebaudengoi]|nr:hypothetical protein C8J57DRAFT_1703818 [Mycena rebaudengoi]